MWDGWQWLVIVIMTATLLGCSAATGIDATERRGPFRGQLVDVETGRPIAGAFVVAVWWDQLPLGLKFYDAREAVTGDDGRFEIPRLKIPLTKLGVGAPQLHFLALLTEPHSLQPVIATSCQLPCSSWKRQ